MSQSRIVALTKKDHVSLTYKAMDDYAFAANTTAMPLLLAEVPQAARCFPIIFPDPRNATPHALLGLGGKNIFVDGQGRWTAAYVPHVAANHPFSLMEARFTDDAGEPGKFDLALAVEEDAPQFHQADGVPLYDQDGEPTELLRHIMSVMGKQYRHYRESEKVLAELHLSGALRERVVSLRRGGVERKVGGLRCADQEKIMALPDVALSAWVKSGVMEMLFAHWRSMRHLQTLLDDPSCLRPDAEGQRKQ